MLYSTSRSSLLRHLAAACGLSLVIVHATARAEGWQWQPWVTLSGGYENDRVIDPDLDRLTVPGGGFVDFIPGVSVYRDFGATQLGFTGQGSLERFINDQDRTLYSVAGNANARGELSSAWRWRIDAAGNYYAESDRETVNRSSGGGAAALRFAAARWYLEARGGADARRYDNLIALDDAGVEGTYTEKSASAGLTAGVLVLRGLALTAGASQRFTDARSAEFDAVSTTAHALVQARVARSGFFSVNGLAQLREFDSRDPDLDSDEYWQVGAGYDHRVSDMIVLTTRYAFARYTQPTAPDQDTHRVSLGITIRFGASSSPAAAPAPPVEDDVLRFRVHAPGAKSVSLVGDFNGWDPSVHPMTRGDGGWWEVGITLPAGSYQYAYRVDGVTVTPPDAEVIVDDGFGGRNGVIVVSEKSR